MKKTIVILCLLMVSVFLVSCTEKEPYSFTISDFDYSENEYGNTEIYYNDAEEPYFWVTGGYLTITAEKPGVAQIFYKGTDVLAESPSDLNIGETKILFDYFKIKDIDADYHEIEICAAEEWFYNKIDEGVICKIKALPKIDYDTFKIELFAYFNDEYEKGDFSFDKTQIFYPMEVSKEMIGDYYDPVNYDPVNVRDYYGPVNVVVYTSDLFKEYVACELIEYYDDVENDRIDLYMEDYEAQDITAAYVPFGYEDYKKPSRVTYKATCKGRDTQQISSVEQTLTILYDD